MNQLVRFIYQVLHKDEPVNKRDTKTKKYAREVIDKYKKTLKRLSYE